MTDASARKFAAKVRAILDGKAPKVHHGKAVNPATATRGRSAAQAISRWYLTNAAAIF